MSINLIQFQPGLSRLEFLNQSGTEVKCEAELEQVRWPHGFVCPCCAHTGHSVFEVGLHKMFQCQACRHQTSLIARTLFQSTRLPLTVWFLAIYLISQAKTGLSSLALRRHPGASYHTAQLVQRKLKDALSGRETAWLSWSPLPPGLAQTPDFGQLKSLDDQENKER